MKKERKIYASSLDDFVKEGIERRLYFVLFIILLIVLLCIVF